jgi:hypothetical protein
VETLELQVRDGRLRNAEVFIFTDNSTAEGVFYKGNSTSKKLFELVLRLRRMEMEAQLILHVIHVAGTRMIEEGADGGSRGDLTQGVMAGKAILDYVPLNLSALTRSDKVEPWIRSWWNSDYGELKTLEPEGWYDEAHAEGCFLWAPPPAAADVAAELLGEAKHKRPMCAHIVVVPRLMTGRWRRAMIKESDFWTTIPAGTSFWPAEMHEPLTICISFPLIRCNPWCIKGTPFLEKLGRELRPLWLDREERCRDLLRELLVQTSKFQSMQEGMVRRMLYSPTGKSLPSEVSCR